MQQRGRKSTAQLATVRNLTDTLPEPPGSYTEEHAQHWRAIVASKPMDWWDSGCLPILDSYCKAIVEHRRLSEILEAMHPLESDEDFGRYDKLQRAVDRLSKLMITSATKLRLTPQSRYNAQSAHTASKKASGSRPWAKD